MLACLSMGTLSSPHTGFFGVGGNLKYNTIKMRQLAGSEAHCIYSSSHWGKSVHDIIPTTALVTKIVKLYVAPLLNVAHNFRI